jgi:hypothetical protein
MHYKGKIKKHLKHQIYNDITFKPGDTLHNSSKKAIGLVINSITLQNTTHLLALIDESIENSTENRK